MVCFIVLMFRWLWIQVSYWLIFIRVASLALGQSYDSPSAIEVILKNMGTIGQYLTTTTHNIPQTVCLLFRMPCISQIARFVGPTWSPPGPCRPKMGPMNLAIGVYSRKLHIMDESQRLLSLSAVPGHLTAGTDRMRSLGGLLVRT